MGKKLTIPILLSIFTLFLVTSCTNTTDLQDIIEEQRRLIEEQNRIIEDLKDRLDEDQDNDYDLEVISPNGGENRVIGESYTIKWSLDGNVQEDYVIGFLLTDGKTPGQINFLRPIPSNGEQEWEISDSISTGYDIVDLEPGRYKLEIVLYDDFPCIGICPPNYPHPNILERDKSDDFFNIKLKGPLRVPLPDPETEYACQTDDDCIIAKYKKEACCPYPCGSEEVINKEEQERRSNWRSTSQTCEDRCLLVGMPCAKPEETTIPFCDNNICKGSTIRYDSNQTTEYRQKEACNNSNGEWTVYSDGCSTDSCNLITAPGGVPNYACAAVPVESCDCGPDKCWAGYDCISNPY